MIKRFFCRTVALLCSLVILCSGISVAFPSALAAPAKPSQVSGLKASAGTTYVTLTWNKASSASGYAVFSYNTKTDKYKVLKNTSETSYKVTGLNASTTYYYAVQAYKTEPDGERSYGEVSKNVKVKTKSATPSQVKGLKTSTVNATSVKLKWTKIADAKYVVYTYNTKTEKYTKLGTASGNTYTAKNLKADTDYLFAVRAYKTVAGKNYYGKYSAKLSVTTAPATLNVKQARSLFEDARKVYMDWIYSCKYISYDHTVTHEFYGMPCQFAAVEHSSVKEKKDIVNLLDKYFQSDIYENELYLYVELDGRLYGKLYYYAEGGKSDTDSVTMYYTDKLKKVSATKYQYILYPVYYSGVKTDNLPKSYTYSLVRKDNRWVFTDIFYPCCAEIRA